jgi:hypothetical protein
MNNFSIYCNVILREINDNSKYQNDFTKFINRVGNESIRILNDNKKN